MAGNVARSATCGATCPFGALAEMLGGYGEEVHDPVLIPGRCNPLANLWRSPDMSAVVNIWVDPAVYAPAKMRRPLQVIINEGVYSS